VFKPAIELVEDIEPYRIMFDSIENDHNTKSPWGLRDICIEMYDHNYRRKFYNVPMAIAYIPSSDVKHFNKIWEMVNIDEKKSIKIHKNDKDIEIKENPTSVKHFCRKFVLRYFLD
jgi:hypothetical protein